jgi:nicotinate-nucleotide adenylyltransferase
MSTSFQDHLALFGGSFNPPHLGHVIAVEGLRKNPGVKGTLIVPSFGTPLKKVAVSFEDRLEMARLAFSHHAEVSDTEAREKITYTWQLLEHFQGLHQKVAFVIGTDQFASLGSWARFPRVLGLADWIVLLRKPDGMETIHPAISRFAAENLIASTADPREWRVTGSPRVIRFVETEAPMVSGTSIREALESGKKETVRGHVPKPVLEFIERKHLYGT